jgi:hypothetical protein
MLGAFQVSFGLMAAVDPAAIVAKDRPFQGFIRLFDLLASPGGAFAP